MEPAAQGALIGASGAVSVAIVSGIVAIVVAVLNSRRAKSNEHTQWLRNEKVEIYTNLLRQVHASNRALDHYKATGENLDVDLSDIKDITNARLITVGSRAVRHKANDMLNVMMLAGQSQNIDDSERFETWNRRRGEAVAELEATIRKDLKTEEKVRTPLKVRFWKVIYFFTDPFQKWYFEKYGVAWITKHPTRAMKKHMRANGINPKDR